MYDHWLYPVFESIGLAEPRSVWLARAPEAGTVRVVVTPTDRARIDGIPQTLPELGYRRLAHVGPFVVWTLQPGAGIVDGRQPARRRCGIVLDGGQGKVR